jgi:hypothetical protein
MKIQLLAKEQAGHRLRSVILLRCFPPSGSAEGVGERWFLEPSAVRGQGRQRGRLAADSVV